MKRSDYLEKRREITEEYEHKLTILDEAFRLFNGTPVQEKAAPGARTGIEWVHPISKRDAVRESLKAMTEATITLKTAKVALKHTHPELAEEISDNQLSAILSKFAEMGELAILRKKVGTTPAVYGRPQKMGEGHA
jgi:hypothetical protein